MYRTDTKCRIDGANALHRRSKCLPKYALVAIVLWLPFAALAKDLELLTRYLIPPFLAQNFTAACRNNDASFLANLPHGAGTVDEFAQRMKTEITENLTNDEAANIVLVAANTALKAARDEMRKLSPEYPRMDVDALNRWCRTEGQSYILAVMEKDAREHDSFIKIIEAAKR